ncbi:beta-ketoacyl synthase [Pseudonocardia sp. GCM10023141]|uniref:beta-ketoacyl synthase n=1 Tax=Pseudonocardia sp. GCM10023141 TaxID=3252653 RepID=UPI003609E1B1
MSEPIMSELDTLGFDGRPFDALDALSPVVRTAAPAPVVATGPDDREGAVADLVATLSTELLAAHHAAMNVQVAWQERQLEALRAGRSVPTRGVIGPDSRGVSSRLAAARIAYRREGELEPLATTTVAALGPGELALLCAGRAGAVFGARYDQPAPALPEGPLRSVAELRPGGPSGAGVLIGTCAAPLGEGDVRVAARQAGSVLALWLGLHLCVPDARLTTDGGAVELCAISDGEAEVVAEIRAADLLPRPWLRLSAEFRAGEQVLARIHDLTVIVREPDGTPIGTRRGGNPPARPVRRGVTGALAVVDELALATASRGDLTMALGPEFERYTARRATRPPAGGLRLVGRVMAVHGTRGDLTGGATGETEYDCAADAWYFGAAPHPSVPNVILMETSLQSALLLGYHLGATLVDPDTDYSLRNLDGSATLHRDVDLRGRTICQRSTLLTTTVLTGAVLQGLGYRLWLDGEDPDRDPPFYEGQSLFGFFSATALANQTGLDNGASVPTWLEEHPGSASREIPVATGATGELDLLDRMEVVDGGGRHGGGYLRATRPVAASDWYFARHFHLDPVMPGSLGVEAVIQALQAWLLDTGALAGLTEPEFGVPAGVELAWRYRGQILAGDGELTLEVHIRDVTRRAGRVRVVADASLWRPGLRIYELDGIAAEAREKGAPLW